VGLEATRLVLGKHSGRHAFRDKLWEMGYRLPEERINSLFIRFKELADRKKNVEEEDLVSLVEEKWGGEEEIFTLETIQLSYGNRSVPTASVRIFDLRRRQALEEAACGNGSVDAIFKAIDRVTGEVMHLEEYKIASVTHGKDALGEVFVKLRQGDCTVQGRGVSTDVLEASARAYIHAVNRLAVRVVERKRETVPASSGS
jgi:2-isopropylmalate synthase